jgi:hypothetical protein
MPSGWRWLSLAIAALSLIASVMPLFGVSPFDLLMVAVIAGILLPIWAIWLALRGRDVWPELEPDSVVVFEPSP